MANTAKMVKPVSGRKALENGNEDAIVSSSSGFLSGEEDAVSSSKGKGRGRKAKKETVNEGTLAKVTKASSGGQERKKVPNMEDKIETVVKVTQEFAAEKKLVASKKRGKKVSASLTDDLPGEIEHVMRENSVEKTPAKRGRKIATAKVEAIDVQGSTPSGAPSTSVTTGRVRGKKAAAAAVVSAEEDASTQAVLEEPIKRRGQKRSSKETKESAGLVKETKNKISKDSKLTSKVESFEPSDVPPVKETRKKAKLDSKAPRNELEEHKLDEPLDKPVRIKIATKRKATKEYVVEKSIEAKNTESVAAVEDPVPNEKKKPKKGPKVKITKEIKSTRGKTSKLLEDTGELLENGSTRNGKKPGRTRAATAVDVAVIEGTDEVDGTKATKSKKGPLLNATHTEYNKGDFELEAKSDCAAGFNFKISSWNVAGLRSWLKKDGLRFLDYELPDIFCLQEIKCTTDQLPDEVARIPGYHPYWLCMPGGYAGVAIYSKIMPINVEYGIGNAEFDAAGRMITAEYEKFYLINVYVPNSGRKLVNLDARMRWEKLFQEYIKRLDAIKPIIICGDMNVSHQPIDLANPKTNTRSAGFTQEERDKMTELLALGFIDTFRYLYPKRTDAYTYWTYMANARLRNVGWRLDYFIVSERFIKRVVENCMRSQVMGSDHCPITLFLNM